MNSDDSNKLEPGAELTLEQVKCLDIFYELGEKEKPKAEQLAEQLRMPVTRIRAEIYVMTGQGILSPKTRQLTERGLQIYKNYLKKREEMMRWLDSRNVPKEQLKSQADRLLAAVSTETLDSISAFNKYRRSMEAGDSIGRILRENDLTGILSPGKYEFSVSLQDRLRSQHGGYAGISEAAGWFERIAFLTAEPLQSRVQLRWKAVGRELTAVSYTNRERMQLQYCKPENGTVTIPTVDLVFRHVKSFSVLVGELDIVLHTVRQENERTVREETPATLCITPGYYQAEQTK